MLHYSILKYATVTSRSTSMTLGILFHDPTIDHREFRFTQDLSRLSQITPAVDVAMVEKLLRGIKEEVEMGDWASKPFDIEDYTRFYLNDFCFGDVERVECEDLNGTIDRIAKICL